MKITKTEINRIFPGFESEDKIEEEKLEPTLEDLIKEQKKAENADRNLVFYKDPRGGYRGKHSVFGKNYRFGIKIK